MRSSVIFGLALLNTVAQAKWEIDANTCKGSVDFIKEELGQAHKMALAGKNLLDTEGEFYYKKFMSTQAKDQISAMTKLEAPDAIRKVFQKSADLLNEEGDTVVKITCDNKTADCQDTGNDDDTLAHVIESSGTLNLCKSFLSDTVRVSKLQKDCDILYLSDVSYRSAAMTLVHETMHYKQVMEPILGGMAVPEYQKCQDFADSIEECLDLAAGKLEPIVKRSSTSTQKICLALKNAASTKSKATQTTKKTSRAEAGCLDESFTMMNAESYALIAGGAYFTDLCKEQIPLLAPASSSSGSSMAGSPSA